MNHEAWMQLTIAEAERARGKTGDNPWVGCIIVGEGERVLARGHTQGPGEDHAEIVAAAEARAAGESIVGATLYSTLEPCSFHGRTPACAHVIVREKLGRVVIAMRDPNPRVDGVGIRILRDAGIEVIEGPGERDVRRQLGSWVFAYHPHEPKRRAQSMPPEDRERILVEMYGVDVAAVRALVTER